MGNQAVVVILTDGLHEIEGDPNFGKHLCEAIQSQFGSRPKTTLYASNGRSSGNVGEVVTVHHNSTTSLIAAHGGTAYVLGHDGMDTNLSTSDARVALLKRILSDMGYSIRKKPQKTS